MTYLPPLEPSTALVAYAESILDGGRVLVIGNALSRLPAQLLERGARWVYVADPDPARIRAAAGANPSRDVTYASLTDESLALREGSFDVAIVENLAEAGDIALVLRNVHRALAPTGAALIASPNPEATLHLVGRHDPSAVALDYYSLYDAVAAQFRSVRMIGQAPFVAYAMVDFAPEGEPEPAIDTGFVAGGAEEPEWFIALGSHTKTALDAFTVVQVGFKDAWKALVAQATPKPAASADPRRHRLPARTLVRGAEAGETPTRPGLGQPAEREALERELLKRDTWLAELEKRASTADARADETQAALDDLVDKSNAERAEALASRETLEQQKLLAEKASQTLEREQATERARYEAERKRLESELKQHEGDIAKLREVHAKLEHEATALRQAQIEAEREAKGLRQARAELERERTALGQTCTELQAEVAAQKEKLAVEAAKARAASVEVDSKDEVVALERQLVERGEVVRKLERDLRTAEQVGKELISELEQRSEHAPVLLEAASLKEKLDALARTNAVREADLAAAEWRVQDLENRLSLASAVSN